MSSAPGAMASSMVSIGLSTSLFTSIRARASFRVFLSIAATRARASPA